VKAWSVRACTPTALPKMMLGFVVRRCTVEMGHPPSPEEFAAWANHYKEGDHVFSLFGRPITVDEARLILRHPARVVTAKGAAPHECVLPDEVTARAGLADIISLAAVRARMKARAK
jgi:hypothetical protein